MHFAHCHKKRPTNTQAECMKTRSPKRSQYKSKETSDDKQGW